MKKKRKKKTKPNQIERNIPFYGIFCVSSTAVEFKLLFHNQFNLLDVCADTVDIQTCHFRFFYFFSSLKQADSIFLISLSSSLSRSRTEMCLNVSFALCLFHFNLFVSTQFLTVISVFYVINGKYDEVMCVQHIPSLKHKSILFFIHAHFCSLFLLNNCLFQSVFG